MPTTHISTTPYWATSATFPPFAKLAEDVETEMVKRVVVLERDRCAMTDTGHTTAHLAMVTDARLTELAKRFGRDHA